MKKRELIKGQKMSCVLYSVISLATSTKICFNKN